MLKLNNNIKISNVEFDFVHEVVINSSWEELTDTCEIVIPKKIRFTKNNEQIQNVVRGDNALFKRNDDVTVNCGYGDQIGVRFVGYVSNIVPRKPLMFSCQDLAYKLKQTTVNYSAKDVSLNTVLENIIPSDIKFRTNVDFTIGKITIEKSPVSQALEFLRETFGIISFVRDNVLVCGVAYELTNINDVTIHDIDLEQRGIDVSSLEYIREDDRQIKVTAVSIYPDNTKKEVTVGNENGGARTQYFYNVSESDLKTYAEQQLEKFQYDGFSGSFTTFLNPHIKHGDAVRLSSEEIPDANGVYLVKRVVTTCGVSGGRQEVHLDRKIN